MDFKLLNQQFHEQINVKKIESLPTEKFKFFVDNLLKSTNYSQKKLSEQIGVSQNIISKWKCGIVDPENLKSRNFSALASMAGWTVINLYNFIYSIDSESLSYEEIENQAKKLSIMEMLALSRELSNFAYLKLTEISGISFAEILKKYLEVSNQSNIEAAETFRITPLSRFEEIIQGDLPTKVELMRLASAQVLLKEDGSKYSFVELYNQAYGFYERL